MHTVIDHNSNDSILQILLLDILDFLENSEWNFGATLNFLCLVTSLMCTSYLTLFTSSSFPWLAASCESGKSGQNEEAKGRNQLLL